MSLASSSARIRGRAWSPVSGQPFSHQLRVDAGYLGQRTDDELARNADAKTAGDELVPHQAAAIVELAPILRQACAQLCFGQAAQREQARFDPLGQRQLAGLAGIGQHVRYGFGEIADGCIAFGEQPVRNACDVCGKLPHEARGHRLPRFAARQEIDRPRTICRVDALEIRREDRELCARRIGGVERGVQIGEATHDWVLVRIFDCG